jgi:hypothetical protein
VYNLNAYVSPTARRANIFFNHPRATLAIIIGKGFSFLGAGSRPVDASAILTAIFALKGFVS